MLGLMLVTALLTAGGAILNDLMDYKSDREAHPDRPLPAKRIKRLHALLVVIGFFVIGLLLSSVIGQNAITVAGLLVGSILFYDVLLKDIPIAPVAIGLCRACTLLLGLSLIPLETSTADLGLRIYLICIAGTFGLGIAALLSHQSELSDRRQILTGSIFAWVSILALVPLPILYPKQVADTRALPWIALLMFLVGWHTIRAILTPERKAIDRAFQTGQLGFLLFSGAIVAGTRGILISLLFALFLAGAVALDYVFTRGNPSRFLTRFRADSLPEDVSESPSQSTGAPT
jgi:4-hydroxybenzoate polyprenyltransferase